MSELDDTSQSIGRVCEHDVGPTDADLVFWEQSQSRIAGYLTTNGQIEISLCGLWATVTAVILTLNASGDSESVVVTGVILPVFSLVVLGLAANVYSWIRLQMDYLAVMGHHPMEIKALVSYEQWRVAISRYWDNESRATRLKLIMKRGTIGIMKMPLEINNIYSYYFTLYFSTALAGCLYSVAHGLTWIAIPVCVVLACGLYTSGSLYVLKLDFVGQKVRELIVPTDTATIEEMTDDN